MKKYLLFSLFVSTLLLIIPSITVAQEAMDDQFVHTVFFWFNEPDNSTHKAEFEKSLTKFMENSKFVSTYHIGRPANTPREVVDNSYTYKLTVTFPNREQQDKYQEEKAHKLFIEESEQYWKTVKVFDSISID